jgi:hydrogenase 3 maturation protease
VLSLPSLKDKKVVFLAVGNDMNGDDAFGPLVYQYLAPFKNGAFLPLNGGQMPENMTSKIKSFTPDVLIIADAALGIITQNGQSDLDFKPTAKAKSNGAAPLKIIKGSDFAVVNFATTHTLPLNILINFIKRDLHKLEVIFIACLAKNTDFGSSPSPAVKKAAQIAKAAILSSIT